MLRVCFSLILISVLAAKITSQSPVLTEAKDKHIAEPITTHPLANPLQFSVTTLPRGYLDDKDVHPTLKTYSALSRMNYSQKYYRLRRHFFDTDPVLKQVAKAETPEQYVAGFDQLRPSQEIKDSKERSKINYSVSALMTAHMQHTQRSLEFQRMARSVRAMASLKASGVASRARKREASIATDRTKDRKTPVRQLQTKKTNAQAFERDMRKAGFSPSGNAVKMEEDSRPLIALHGRKGATRKLVDYLYVEGKNNDYINRVLALRVKYNREQYGVGYEEARRKHRNTRFLSSPSNSPSPSPFASTSSLPFSRHGLNLDHSTFNSGQHTSPDRLPSPLWQPAEFPTRSGPPSPTFSDALGFSTQPSFPHPFTHAGESPHNQYLLPFHEEPATPLRNDLQHHLNQYASPPAVPSIPASTADFAYWTNHANEHHYHPAPSPLLMQDSIHASNVQTPPSPSFSEAIRDMLLHQNRNRRTGHSGSSSPDHSYHSPTKHRKDDQSTATSGHHTFQHENWRSNDPW